MGRVRTLPVISRQRGPNTSVSSTGIAPLSISSACRIGSRPSASASSMTKVRFRSLDDCEIMCTRSLPNVAHTSESLCSSERMPRPTRVIAAHGTMILTRQISARSADSAASTSVLTRFSLGSSDTVTLVSAEPIRSTDRPCLAKRANTSARKPTCCHMPMPSIDTSTMPLRRLIALTPGTVRALPSMLVPGSSGRSVSRIAIGTPLSRHGLIERGCSTLAPVVAISCAS